MTTMTSSARRSATKAYAEVDATTDRALEPAAHRSTDRRQRRRDQRIAAAAEAGWLLALR